MPPACPTPPTCSTPPAWSMPTACPTPPECFTLPPQRVGVRGGPPLALTRCGLPTTPRSRHVPVRLQTARRSACTPAACGHAARPPTP
eukprot:365169-Chlamydomonas_euryale.AAC.16